MEIGKFAAAHPKWRVVLYQLPGAGAVEEQSGSDAAAAERTDLHYGKRCSNDVVSVVETL